MDFLAVTPSASISDRYLFQQTTNFRYNYRRTVSVLPVPHNRMVIILALPVGHHV